VNEMDATGALFVCLSVHLHALPLKLLLTISTKFGISGSALYILGLFGLAHIGPTEPCNT